MVNAEKTPPTTIFVAGLGRCGTTMMMHVLRAGGVPVAGPAPAFEVREMAPGAGLAVRQAWVEKHAGKAIKWIDPIAAPLALPKNSIAILMRRDRVEQAKSQMKMIALTVPGANTRSARRAMAAMIRVDVHKTWAQLQLVTDARLMAVDFEDVIVRPAETMKRLEDFLADCDVSFDSAAGQTAILRRPVACEPLFDIEQKLLEAEHGR